LKGTVNIHQRITLIFNLIFEMADNLCVICQDAIVVGDNTTVPLACMHTYHRECIKGYVALKKASNQDIKCPVCQLQSFQHGTTEYNAFCMSLSDSRPSDIRSQATSLPMAVTPRSARSVSVTNVPQVSINVYEIRPFYIPDEEEKSCRCSLGFMFLIMLFIALSVISIVLVVMFT
jgi:hypothetical protein